MMKKSFLIIGVLLVCAVVAWKIAYPSGSWRYKMTVTVETPEGVKTGAAVREAHLYREISVFPQQGGSFYNITKGEAAVVDLGERGVLFALLGGQGEAVNVATTFGMEHRQSGLVDLTLEQYPRFVRFRDLKDPKTVESLRETSGCLEKDKTGTCVKEGFHVVSDRFEEAFGAGVKLKSVTIEMTDEEVTWGGIKSLLPWFDERSQLPGYLGGDTTIPFKDASMTYLTPNNFRQGDQK